MDNTPGRRRIKLSIMKGQGESVLVWLEQNYRKRTGDENGKVIQGMTHACSQQL